MSSKIFGRFERLHKPLSRSRFLPFCGTFLKPEGQVSENAESKSSSNTLDWYTEEEKGDDGDEDVMISLMINPVNENRCQTKVGEDGVVETTIDDWSPTPFKPIVMLNLDNPAEERMPLHAVKRYGMYFVRLANVVAPNNFFMEFIIEPPDDGCKTWEESLQLYYNNPEIVEKYKMRTIKPFLDRMYVFLDEQTGKWQRVRVLKIDMFEESVIVVNMDHLVARRSIPVSSLVEVHPKFANWHRYPLNGGLRDVKPRNLFEDDDNWSDDAKVFFRRYVANKTFQAFIVGKGLDTHDNVFHSLTKDRFVKVSVILFEVGQDIPVNAWLVQKGYAKPIRSMCNSFTLMQNLHDLDLAVEEPQK